MVKFIYLSLQTTTNPSTRCQASREPPLTTVFLPQVAITPCRLSLANCGGKRMAPLGDGGARPPVELRVCGRRRHRAGHEWE